MREAAERQEVGLGESHEAAVVKRRHSLTDAGAGDLGLVPSGEVIGACPSCQAELRICLTLNPISGNFDRAMQHPVPFCTYFGETDPAEIERAIVRGHDS